MRAEGYGLMATLWDSLVGHDWARRALADAVRLDRVSHATLITGPTQIGKTTVARLLAQAVNCQAPAPGDRPCGVCRPCELIGADRHPDVRLVMPEVTKRGRGSLRIDTIRELRAWLQLAPYEARFKVAIVRQFEATSQGAANAFLKTLEEPPARVKLILTATDADALLDTIRSRCRVIALRPLARDTVAAALRERWRVETETADRLAALSGGRLGWAVDAAADPAHLAQRATLLAHLDSALAGSRVARFKLADTIARDPEQIEPLLETWLSWWRDLIIVVQRLAGMPDPTTATMPSAIRNVDCWAQFAQLAGVLSSADVIAAVKATRAAQEQLAANANTRLVLENLLLAYPRPALPA